MPSPMEDRKLVLLYPAALQKEALHRNHDKKKNEWDVGLNQRYITLTGIGNGVDSVDFIETFRVIVFHAR